MEILVKVAVVLLLTVSAASPAQTQAATDSCADIAVGISPACFDGTPHQLDWVGKEIFAGLTEKENVEVNVRSRKATLPLILELGRAKSIRCQLAGHSSMGRRYNRKIRPTQRRQAYGLSLRLLTRSLGWGSSFVTPPLDVQRLRALMKLSHS